MDHSHEFTVSVRLVRWLALEVNCGQKAHQWWWNRINPLIKLLIRCFIPKSKGMMILSCLWLMVLQLVGWFVDFWVDDQDLLLQNGPDRTRCLDVEDSV